MSKIKNYDLKIGDDLFKYVGLGEILKYTVIGIHTYENITQYKIQCLNCNGHSPCELLINYDDHNRLKYVCMCTEIDDEGDYFKNHFYWHNDTKYYFFLNKNELIINIYEQDLKELNAEIKELKEKTENKEKELVDIELKLNILKNKDKEAKHDES